MSEQYLFCCFLDVLGFKNIIKDWEKAKRYYAALIGQIFYGHASMIDALQDEIIKQVKTFVPEHEVNDQSVKWRIISDSIILTSEDPINLMRYTSQIQYYSFLNGYWTRGCIAHGRHLEFEKEQNYFVVSEALSEAYFGESELAKYPRVLIHPDCLPLLETQLFKRGGNQLLPIESNLLLQSEDDSWFVNPFVFMADSDLKIFSKSINEQIDKYKDSEFRDKYLWVGDLYNYISAPGHILDNWASYYNKKDSYYYSLKNLCTNNELAGSELAHTWKYSNNFYIFFRPRVPLDSIALDNNLIVNLSESPYKRAFRENLTQWKTYYSSLKPGFVAAREMLKKEGLVD